MFALNLPEYEFTIMETSPPKIFDPIRKKYVTLTPEEWVRQNFLMFLVKEKNYPAPLIFPEQSLTVLKLRKRCDAVVYDKKGCPLMIIEFKSPDVPINQKVFDQIARYNMALNVNYLVVSNGREHFSCFIDIPNKTYRFLEQIPTYSEL